MAGLDTTGLTIKRTDDLVTDLGIAVKSTTGFGPQASVDPDGPLGKLIGIFAIEIATVWEGLQQVYDAIDPDAATGEALDNLAGIRGVPRLGATETTGDIALTGTPTTVIPLGAIVSIGNNGARFVTTIEVTIPGGGSVDVTVEAEESGPIEATAGSIDTIVTVIAGWFGITHAVDLVTGRDIETDAALRLRSEDSLQIAGAATDGAIRAEVATIEEVTTAIVRSNRTAVVVDGIPPHAFETIVYPLIVPAEDVIAAIFRKMPSGIEPFGSTTGTVTDSQGYSQTVGFSYATEADVFIDITVTTDALYPATGDDDIKDNLEAVFAAFDVGDDVRILDLVCAAAEVPGVLTAVALARVGLAPGPGDNVNIITDFRTIAVVDRVNIVVNS